MSATTISLGSLILWLKNTDDADTDAAGEGGGEGPCTEKALGCLCSTYSCSSVVGERSSSTRDPEARRGYCARREGGDARVREPVVHRRVPRALSLYGDVKRVEGMIEEWTYIARYELMYTVNSSA